ncbi:2-hydroxyacid dehydrogenase [Myroides fluvii]|uniref:2-hydroxyacid dehydrogenase n=1 Tax=Myroides fluvii TaxID=2572594 RepID=UPI00131ACB9E|nr:2-hydroxyacid dehydrogenase [Myroides fluvii]
MTTKKVLHLDSNHPLMLTQLDQLGYVNIEDYTSSKEKIEETIHEYEGVIIRSRFKIDQSFLEKATQLKFIGRVGAGLENIDCEFAASKGIVLIAAPEGNQTAVGEHALGMLLTLFNKLNIVDQEVRRGIWIREGNRGHEIEGKTVGIIGYGHMGNALAKRLQGFDCEVIFHDIKDNLSNPYAKQVSLAELQQRADIVSLHIPQTAETTNLVDKIFIEQMAKPFWLINTARGKSVHTADLIAALESGKVKGAALDVLEYEKSSFEHLFADDTLPEPMRYLIESERVLLSPHIAGWTFESKEKLAQVIIDKIRNTFHEK